MQIIVSEKSDPQAIREWLGVKTKKPKIMLVMGDPGDRIVRQCTAMAMARKMPIKYMRPG